MTDSKSSRTRWAASLLGCALGAATAAGLVATGLLPTSGIVALALVGLLGGRVLELEGALSRSNTKFQERISAVERSAQEHVSAKSEAERRLVEAHSEWALRVRKLAHDVRTPLSVLKSNVGFLRETPPAELRAEAGPALEDLELGVQQVERLLADASAHAKGYDG